MENPLPISQLLIIIFGSGGIGALFTTLINHFFTLKNAEKERGFLFKNEQFLLLQNKAEKIFEYIHSNDEMISQMLAQMRSLSIDLKKIKQDDLEFLKRQTYVTLNVNFPELREVFDEYAISLKKNTKVYFDSVLAFGVSEEVMEDFIGKNKKMFELKMKFMNAIIDSLEENKKSVVR